MTKQTDYIEGLAEELGQWCVNQYNALGAAKAAAQYTAQHITPLVEAFAKAKEDVHNFHRDYVHYEGGVVDKELNRIWNEMNTALENLADELKGNT